MTSARDRVDAGLPTAMAAGSYVAIGTSHGAYKFTRKPDGDILALNVVKAINKRLPGLHMVMHGSSSVPQELQDIINANGGEMPQTWGTPVDEIVEGIKNGVRKVNIDTEFVFVDLMFPRRKRCRPSFS